MTQIDIRLLQAAVMVADELSFSRAAARLHLTQPGITKQIQDLEDRLGVVLFERNNQGVSLTEPCRIFIEEARLVLLHLDRAVHLTRAAASGAEAVLNIGSAPDVDPYIVSTVLAARLPLYPALRIHASSNFSQELSRHVITGELDSALVVGGVPDKRLNHTKVETRPLYAVFRLDDELAAKQAVSLNDFNGRVWVVYGRHVHPYLHDELWSLAREKRVRPSDFHHVTTAEEAAQLVTQHRGVAFLVRNGAWRVARDGLTMRPLDEAKLVVQTSLVTRSDDGSRLTSEFVRTSMRRLQAIEPAQQGSLLP